MASLRGVQIPTLVFHGQMDTVLPVAHATALEAGISMASVTIAERMGHIPRLADWLMIAGRITAERT